MPNVEDLIRRAIAERVANGQSHEDAIANLRAQWRGEGLTRPSSLRAAALATLDAIETGE